MLRIRILRIHMLLGLLDPDPDPSIMKQNSKKTLDSQCFVTYFWLLFFEKWCKCTGYPGTGTFRNRKTFFLNLFLSASWSLMTKIAGSGSRSGSGFIRQREEWIRGSGSTPKCQGSATLFFCSHPGAEDPIVRPVTAAGAAELTLHVWVDACYGSSYGSGSDSTTLYCLQLFLAILRPKTWLWGRWQEQGLLSWPLTCGGTRVAALIRGRRPAAGSAASSPAIPRQRIQTDKYLISTFSAKAIIICLVLNYFHEYDNNDFFELILKKIIFCSFS